MSLNFSNQDYLKKASNLLRKPESECSLTREDALLLLLKDLKAEQIDNLNELTSKEGIDLSDSENLSDSEKKCIYDCAFKLLGNKKHLGNEIINGKFNSSAWISHSLWVGRQCADFAKKMGLNPNQAEVIGMLHDFGRREIHTIAHVTRGFELLSDMGYKMEALGCLTHSFVNGGRCASNETSEEDFYVSPEGIPCWEDGAHKDDITLFLESYSYDDYDRILNLSDLMATSEGILSPYDRILDIATRRTIDPTNRGYFLAELINLIAYITDKSNMACDLRKYANIRFNEGKTIDEMMEILKEISSRF